MSQVYSVVYCSIMSPTTQTPCALRLGGRESERNECCRHLDLCLWCWGLLVILGSSTSQRVDAACESIYEGMKRAELAACAPYVVA